MDEEDLHLHFANYAVGFSVYNPEEVLKVNQKMYNIVFERYRNAKGMQKEVEKIKLERLAEIGARIAQDSKIKFGKDKLKK